MYNNTIFKLKKRTGKIMVEEVYSSRFDSRTRYKGDMSVLKFKETITHLFSKKRF